MRQHYTRVHLDVNNFADVARREEAYRTPVVVQKQDVPVYDGVLSGENPVIAETISVGEDGSIGRHSLVGRADGLYD